jgi:hypothetical protein
MNNEISDTDPLEDRPPIRRMGIRCIVHQSESSHAALLLNGIDDLREFLARYHFVAEEMPCNGTIR